MAKQTELEKAIAAIDAKIAALALARGELVEMAQAKRVKAVKPKAIDAGLLP